MQNPKTKYFLITLALSFVIALSLFLFFTNTNQAKIFGCTQYDVYQGDLEHVKLAPTETNCALRSMNIAFGPQDQTLAGLVEYELNITGYFTIMMIFIFIPFIISYSLVLFYIRVLADKLPKPKNE